MGDFGRSLSAGVAVIVLFGAIILSGCISTSNENDTETNLTAGGIADQYLLHYAAITGYQSEYIEIFGLTGETRRVRFDYLTPLSYKVTLNGSSNGLPGSFRVSNGTMTTYYNAETRTYDTSVLNPSGDDGWQATVHRIVSDRNFTILDRAVIGGVVRYHIEVMMPPWSDSYTSFESSRIQAWIEPSTGLAWNISIYKDCVPGTVPTLPPGVVLPDTCTRKEVPIDEIRYEWIRVNTGFPGGYFDFVPPPGSGPRCVPKYVNYVEPPRTDTTVPIDQPLPGGVRYSLNESDSGRNITIQTGEVIEITLPITPGLANRWFMPPEGSGLELMNAGAIYCEVPGEELAFFRARGNYRWRFRAVSPGTEIIDGVFGGTGCDIGNAPRFKITVSVAE